MGAAGFVQAQRGSTLKLPRVANTRLVEVFAASAASVTAAATIQLLRIYPSPEAQLEAEHSAHGPISPSWPADRSKGFGEDQRADDARLVPVNRAGLIGEISRRWQMPRIEAERVVDTIVDSMTAALTRGDKIELRGFGTFHVRSRRARRGRNPKTGAFVHVPPKRVPFFKAGREIRSMLANLTSRRSASATSRPDVVVPEPGQLSPP